MEPTIERKGETVTITQNGVNIEIPLDQLRNAIRKKPQDRKIDCPDLNAFNQFYVSIISERDEQNNPDPVYTSWMWEIFKIIRTREVGFRAEGATTRYANCGKPHFMKQALRQRLAIGGDPFSFFMSSSYIRHSIGGEKADLKENRITYALDYFADIDSPDLSLAHEETAKIIDLLRSNNFKFSVIFSGKKGFHTIIPYRELIKHEFMKDQETYTSDELRDVFRDVNEFIFENTEKSFRFKVPKSHAKELTDSEASKELSKFFKQEGFPLHEGDKLTPDKIGRYTRKNKVEIWSGVIPDPAIAGADTQLQRVPYSIHPSTLLVSLPLTKKQFEDFDKEIATIDNVHDNIPLLNRGIPTF